MANGKLREYYWRIKSHLAERSEYLDTEHSAFDFPDSAEVEFHERVNATLVFRDGSIMHVRTTLDDSADIREYDFAYVYSDVNGKRIFQYDDSPHHPSISTHPDHLHRGEKPARGKEHIHASDLPRVEFIAVLDKVIAHLQSVK
ncbi:MAG: hypothetical protein HY327_01445 [Chloroflexi bacterium]|nr:hypothetical protein [Chloroflexota bacterium]